MNLKLPPLSHPFLNKHTHARTQLNLLRFTLHPSLHWSTLPSSNFMIHTPSLSPPLPIEHFTRNKISSFCVKEAKTPLFTNLSVIQTRKKEFELIPLTYIYRQLKLNRASSFVRNLFGRKIDANIATNREEKKLQGVLPQPTHYKSSTFQPGRR